MEPEKRPADPDLIRALIEEARLYSFFQAVRLLEGTRRDGVSVGREGPPSRETVRLRPSLSLAFPESDLAAVEALEDGGGARYLVETNFLSLYGSTSPLPSFYAEDLLQDSSEDSLVRGVLDLFHHRLLSFLYRCGTKYRPYLVFRPEGDQEFSWRMLCLMGLGIGEAAERSAIPVRWLLRYAGLFNQKPRSAAALGCIVSDFFGGLPVQVDSFASRWVSIPADGKCRLGSANSRLGIDLQVGDRVPDRAGKFRVTLGPMDLETYMSFLPGGPRLEPASGLARSFADDLLAYEMQLELCTAGLPCTRLAPDGVPPLLGHTTWLGDPADIVAVTIPGADGIPTPLSDGGARLSSAGA